MAQTIKIKRGGLASLVASTPALAQGELVLATGSLNGLGSTFFVATASNAPQLPYAKIESITDGPALASSIDNNFVGLLIHSASDNKLYRYSGTAFVELPIAAGSFVGTLDVTSGGTGLNTVNDGDVLVADANDSFTTVSLNSNGAILVGGATPAAQPGINLAGDGLGVDVGDGTLVLKVDVSDFAGTGLEDDGSENLRIAAAAAGNGLTGGAGSALSVDPDTETGGNIQGVSVTANGVGLDINAIAGTGLQADGSANLRLATQGNGIAGGGGSTLSVQNLNNTITVAAGGISVNTGSISNGGTNLVNAGVIYTLSASIATDIAANAGSVSGTTNQVAFFDGASSVTGDAQFTYNSGTDVLTVGTSTFGTNTTIAGNLTVNGTTTTVNSTTVNIDDNIIVVNYGGSETDAGIYAIDNVSTTGTGSLLWDGTNNWWKAGTKTNEYRVVTFDSNGGGTNTAIQKLNSNSYLVDSNITDNDTTVTIANSKNLDVNGGNFSVTGAGSSTLTGAVLFTALTVTDSGNAADEVLFVQSDGTVGQIDATATTDEMVGILGYKSSGGMTFSTVIDGGTF